MTRVAVATTSQLAADAAREVALAGGNAVDCAIAASLLTMNTEPGVCALAGGAYLSIWKPGEAPVTIDGNVNTPGLGLPGKQLGRGGIEIEMDYGGGVRTVIGPGSVAVPGALAAIDMAWRRYGNVRWADLLAGSIAAARQGFRLSSACHHYLQYSGTAIFGRSDDGFRALHDDRDNLLAEGDLIIVPHLADSLELIAKEGAAVFYEGALGATIADFIQETGGMLTRQDLAEYRPLARPSLVVDIDEWRIATNPPPAAGGAMLAAMLLAFGNRKFRGWTETDIARLLDVQHATLQYRRDELEGASDKERQIAAMLREAGSGLLLNRWTSGSTVHTSAVDESGLACAITASAGYGSGEMAPGTGIWLNNCMGELELNAEGLLAGPPGTRLPSNMAPTTARNNGAVMAAGSPGAERITTALHQFFVNYIQCEMGLDEAVRHPRMHLDFVSGEPRVSVEPGIPLPEIDWQVRSYKHIGMFFGGVAAAVYDEQSGFDVAADPRRSGGTFII
jgi:gamma-glutamyltranspeptidase/glutathione hydrolase